MYIGDNGAIAAAAVIGWLFDRSLVLSCTSLGAQQRDNYPAHFAIHLDILNCINMTASYTNNTTAVFVSNASLIR